MSNEENKSGTEVPMQETAPEPQEIQRGPNGEVGQPTVSITLKQMWHEKHFRLEDAPDSKNPRKQVWVPRGGAVSLKQFARQLVASGDATAKDWFDHKAGVLNASRSETNIAAAHAAAAATHTEKRKKASQKQSKSKAKEEAPATIITKAGK